MTRDPHCFFSRWHHIVNSTYNKMTLIRKRANERKDALDEWKGCCARVEVSIPNSQMQQARVLPRRTKMGKPFQGQDGHKEGSSHPFADSVGV